MSAKVNFVVKTNDASSAQIKAALKQANIAVRAVVEVYREEGPEKPGEEMSEAKEQNANNK